LRAIFTSRNWNAAMSACRINHQASSSTMKVGRGRVRKAGADAIKDQEHRRGGIAALEEPRSGTATLSASFGGMKTT